LDIFSLSRFDSTIHSSPANVEFFEQSSIKVWKQYNKTEYINCILQNINFLFKFSACRPNCILSSKNLPDRCKHPDLTNHNIRFLPVRDAILVI